MNEIKKHIKPIKFFTAFLKKFTLAKVKLAATAALIPFNAF